MGMTGELSVMPDKVWYAAGACMDKALKFPEVCHIHAFFIPIYIKRKNVYCKNTKTYCILTNIFVTLAFGQQAIGCLHLQ
jgi:transposase